MRPVFELRDTDAAGRIGELAIPRRDVVIETPALLPVVNPHVQAIEPARLAADFGAEILITNAYILRGSDDLHDEAIDRGVHDLLGFDGAVMTDSGSFQLAEYGDIDVTTEEILAFQRAIGSDIATPVDIPTSPDASRERAEDDLRTTQERLAVAAAFDRGDMLVTAPVQGSTYTDLRESAGEHASGTGLDVFPVGGMVPLLTAYRFDDVADLVVAAKRGLGVAAPVHLFGAGHPMMFAFAAAMGCDLLDSAAYALFAREGRYLTARGTDQVDDLDYLPCECPACTGRSPDDLSGNGERLLAEHNLHVSFGEIRRVKQAIRDGDLLELVEARARSHPALLDGYRALLDHAGWIERHDPVRKGTFFYVSAESARRPEVRRHHDRLARLDVPDRLLLAVDAERSAGYDETWRLIPPFGPVPPGLIETTPLTAEVPTRGDEAAIAAAVEGIDRLAATAPNADVAVAAPGWPSTLLDRLRPTVRVLDDGTGAGHGSRG